MTRTRCRSDRAAGEPRPGCPHLPKTRGRISTAFLAALSLGFSTLAVLSWSTASMAEGVGTITGHVTARSARKREGAVVYIDRVPGRHSPKKVAEMDQRGQQFVPHVLPVVLGTTVKFLNSDHTAHNVFSPDGEKYDLGTWAFGETRTHTYKKLGVYTQLCRLHPSMVGYVIVLQNPYFAVTARDGAFRIERVPPGNYQLKAWHERGRGGPVPVAVASGKSTDVEIPMGRR